MINRYLLKAISMILVFLFLISSSSAVNQVSDIQNKNDNFTPSVKSIEKRKTGDSKIMAIIETINKSLISEYLQTIVGYGPRLTGTYGCEKSAKYIYEQFQEMGLKTRYQNWTKFTTGKNPLKPKPRIFRSQNVEGVLEGKDTSSDKLVIFNAHYDSVKVSPGADDDGSGTAAVLAAAYVLSKFEFNHTIKFVTFSGEEQGLFGSQIYAKEAYENDDEIVVEFNADMIGYCKTIEGENRFRLSGTKDAEWIMNDIDKLNVDFNFNFELPRWIISEVGPGGSDYFSFVQYGYESIAFWEGEWNQNMHTPQDDLDNVNIEYLVKTTRFIAATIANIADITINYPQVKIESPKRGKLYLEGKEKKDLIQTNEDEIRTIVINDIWVWADAKYGDVPIKKVEFYYDSKLQHIDVTPPYKWQLNKFSISKHEIRVVVYDELDQIASDWIKILFINPRIRP